jgi:hypothetical protein
MIDRACTALCLHTRKARIAFFISMIFILLVTVGGAVLLYEPQAMVLPPSVAQFRPDRLADAFVQEFGAQLGENYFNAMLQVAAEGNNLIQNYQYLRSLPDEKGTLTGEEAKARFSSLRANWDRWSSDLLQADHQLVKAVAEDIDEGLSLAVKGLNAGTPFLNQRLFKARGMFHDLHTVLLITEGRSDSYYGETRLGRMVEKGYE